MIEPADAVRVRLDLAYDGARFAGWTRQPGLRTVQGELESALATVIRERDDPPRLTVAGRTDAGVHALAQVAHVDLSPERLAGLERRSRRGAPVVADPDPVFGVAALARRLNGVLGPVSDLWVHSAAIAPDGFDARFSAEWRAYEYRIADASALHDPSRRGSTLWHPATLDVDAMDAAARTLGGLHDWAAFCKPREGATTVRTLLDFGWARDADGVLVARVRADAFCHSMVRALVGASIAVGEHRMPAPHLAEVRDAGVRGAGFGVAPARGLTLSAVGYPPDAELADRAERTRARREAIDRAGVGVSEPGLTVAPRVD